MKSEEKAVHLLHSIPHPDRVVAELVRVTRRGGYLHLIAEDYGMVHFQRGQLDPRDFWHQAPAGWTAKRLQMKSAVNVSQQLIRGRTDSNRLPGTAKISVFGTSSNRRFLV